MRASIFAGMFATFLVLAAPLGAVQGGFTATLSQEQQAAIGLGSLSADERAQLNAIVATEVALARQGDIAGFAGTFSSRRSDGELSSSGIAKLSVAEVAELDRLVEALIAAGPVQARVPKRVSVSEGANRDRLEVHGEISYTYGRSSDGRDFQGGSMSTVIFDRKTGTTVGFTYGQYEGDLYPYYGRYGNGYRGAPFDVRTQDRGAVHRGSFDRQR